MFKPLKVKITPKMLAAAKKRDCGQMNSRSFMKGGGNIIGFLGEEMVKTLSKTFVLMDNGDYDFAFNGKTVDVKTKRQTVPYEPKAHYDASVAATSLHQRVDHYIFCRVYKDADGNFPYGWILGTISKKKFLEKATQMFKGQLDKSNGYFVKENCLNLSYDQLTPIEKFCGKYLSPRV